MYDVVIIGAGVSGSAAARELARYRLKICVVEKEEDVCCGTSKANSGIVHAGYDALPGSLKAELNRLGNEKMGKLAELLDVPFKRMGSLVICTDEDDVEKLTELYERGKENQIPGLELIWDRERLKAMEPNLSDHVVAALYAPTAGIVCPFTLNLALAESACQNGVEFRFNCPVLGIRPDDKGYRIKTGSGDLEARCLVNTAGVYGDIFHNMVSTRKIHITPRKGEYCLLDKNAGSHVNHTVFSLPGKKGKGVLVTQTVHGNLLIGPTAVDIDDRDGTNTTGSGIAEVLEKSGHGVRNIPMRQVITSFAGLRAHEDEDDFIIGEAEGAPGFIDCVGIESPGLTACPAIGEKVAGIVASLLQAVKKNNFQEKRTGILNPSRLTLEERNELIGRQPSYGTIICRCEMVSEGEILDAIHRPLGARSLDGIKRRTRAGMGRCQSGFCSPRVMELLSREVGEKMTEITKCGGASQMIVGISKPAGRSENEKL